MGLFLFISGCFVGSVFTLFAISLANAASYADDQLLGDDQYRE